MNTSMLIEPEITVDTNTREIYVPKELYNIGVVGDNNAESVVIRMPRYFDGNDFSTKNCHISFNNALMERGVYDVEKIDVSDDFIFLEWEIRNNVTKKDGIVHFIIEFEKKPDERGKDFYWTTKPASLSVSKGLDDEIVNTENDYSLYLNLLNSIQQTDAKISSLVEMVMTTNESIALLEERVAAIEANTVNP